MVGKYVDTSCSEDDSWHDSASQPIQLYQVLSRHYKSGVRHALALVLGYSGGYDLKEPILK